MRQLHRLAGRRTLDIDFGLRCATGRVAGFSDGMESSVPVRLAGALVVSVVSLPALLVLKIFAWLDRKQEKRDAPDTLTLLKDYGDAGNEDRLCGEALNILEADGYDVEIAGARLLGGDGAAKHAISLKENTQATILLRFQRPF